MMMCPDLCTPVCVPLRHHLCEQYWKRQSPLPVSLTVLEHDMPNTGILKVDVLTGKREIPLLVSQPLLLLSWTMVSFLWIEASIWCQLKKERAATPLAQSLVKPWNHYCSMTFQAGPTIDKMQYKGLVIKQAFIDFYRCLTMCITLPEHHTGHLNCTCE